MAKSSNEKLFRTKVLPIMDKVMADLRHKQAEEIGRHTRSLSYIMAGAAGPDGGMSAQAASLDSLRYHLLNTSCARLLPTPSSIFHRP